MTTSVQRRLFTIAEVAEKLGVSTKTVRRRIDDGSIPAVRLGTTTIRVNADELDAWVYGWREP